MPSETTCFLSYAREDAALARKLFDELVSSGAKVWYDQDALRPGERWEATIRRRIRSSRYFLALLSSRAVSKRGFVQTEIREALDVLSEFPDDEIYLIPMRIDECAPTHDRLLELNWVDLFPNWNLGVSKLMRFLNPPGALRATSNPAPALNRCVAVYFDGVYQSDKRSADDRDYWTYLRFHDDGLVLNISSTGNDPTIVALSLTRDNEAPYYSKGTFTLSGSRIRFSAKSKRGAVDYDGHVRGDRMILKHYSHMNQNRSVTEFQFRPVAHVATFKVGPKEPPS